MKNKWFKLITDESSPSVFTDSSSSGSWHLKMPISLKVKFLHASEGFDFEKLLDFEKLQNVDSMREKADLLSNHSLNFFYHELQTKYRLKKVELVQRFVRKYQKSPLDALSLFTRFWQSQKSTKFWGVSFIKALNRPLIVIVLLSTIKLPIQINECRCINIEWLIMRSNISYL